MSLAETEAWYIAPGLHLPLYYYSTILVCARVTGSTKYIKSFIVLDPDKLPHRGSYRQSSIHCKEWFLVRPTPSMFRRVSLSRLSRGTMNDLLVPLSILVKPTDPLSPGCTSTDRTWLHRFRIYNRTHRSLPSSSPHIFLGKRNTVDHSPTRYPYLLHNESLPAHCESLPTLGEAKPEQNAHIDVQWSWSDRGTCSQSSHRRSEIVTHTMTLYFSQLIRFVIDTSFVHD